MAPGPAAEPCHRMTIILVGTAADQRGGLRRARGLGTLRSPVAPPRRPPAFPRYCDPASRSRGAPACRQQRGNRKIRFRQTQILALAIRRFVLQRLPPDLADELSRANP